MKNKEKRTAVKDVGSLWKKVINEVPQMSVLALVMLLIYISDTMEGVN